MPNIYQKIQTVRVELQGKKLKQTGQNKFAGYSYWELKDFLPTVNELFDAHGLFSAIDFGPEKATLTIVNVDKPDETVQFSCPNAEAQLKGCHPIQNLGAQTTYQKRYLFLACTQLSEPCALDATTGKEPPTTARKAPTSPPKAQSKAKTPEAPPPPPPPPQDAPPPVESEPKQTDPDLPLLQGIVEQVSSKSGNTKGKPWTRYGIKIGDKWHNTFDHTDAEFAKKTKGEEVSYQVRENDKGFSDLVFISDLPF